MTIRKIQPWRRLAEAAQALLILGLPFLKINGESALRFDLPSLKLHFFGMSLWMDEFFIVLMGLFFLTFLIITVTLLFGRIWCGWLCPQTVLIDITWFLDRASTKGIVRKAAAYGLTLLVCALVAASLIWYFVSPYDFFAALISGGLGSVVWGFWIALTVILFLDYAFLRHTWCATVCPYAKLQGALFDSATMAIAFDGSRRNECMDCRACVRICPVNIDIRNGLNAACINCAECLDACSSKMAPKGRTGLIDYFFGSPGTKPNLFRTSALLVSAVTFIFFIAFLYFSFTRNPFDLTVMPNNTLKPRLTAQGELINTFILAAENRGSSDREYKLAGTIKGAQFQVQPDRLLLKAGEYRRIPVYIVSPDSAGGPAELTLESRHPSFSVMTRSITLIRPAEAQ